MFVILLAAVGIPLWLLFGVLVVGLWSRRSIRRTPGVFAVKVRALHGSKAEPKWPRRKAYARWVHDVLVVHRGLALIRIQVLPVAGLCPSGARSAVHGLGGDPISIRLRLDGGDVVEVATGAVDQAALQGPFVVVPGRTCTVDADALAHE